MTAVTTETNHPDLATWKTCVAQKGCRGRMAMGSWVTEPFSPISSTREALAVPWIPTQPSELSGSGDTLPCVRGVSGGTCGGNWRTCLLQWVASPTATPWEFCSLWVSTLLGGKCLWGMKLGRTTLGTNTPKAEWFPRSSPTDQAGNNLQGCQRLWPPATKTGSWWWWRNSKPGSWQGATATSGPVSSRRKLKMNDQSVESFEIMTISKESGKHFYLKSMICKF